ADLHLRPRDRRRDRTDHGERRDARKAAIPGGEPLGRDGHGSGGQHHRRLATGTAITPGLRNLIASPMTPVLDLVYVTLFAVVAPVMDYLVFWRAFRRRADADPARVRVWLWTWTIVWAWAVVAIGLALWIASGRPWALLGLTLPKGWRLGA